jgi:galactokinase
MTARVAAAFVEWMGRQPDGIWAAPGRVNLIGEHTDYNDGFVLPAAIDRHVVVAAGRRPDRRIRAWSAQEGDAPDQQLGEPGLGGGWAAYVGGVAWALGADGAELGGFDLVVDSDLPAGAGLSSSAALEGAVAMALADLFAAPFDRKDLALAGQRAEAEIVGMPCGIMDQMAVLLGRAGHALFIDTRSLAAELVPLPPGLDLVVIDTRVARRLAAAPYAERRQACEAAAALLGVAALRDVSLPELEAAADRLGPVRFRRARHVVTENARVLALVAALAAGDPPPWHSLMAASHASLRDDFEVSCPELDLATSTAVEAGAVAARMTGAGFGGSAIALVPGEPGLVEELTQAVEAAFAAGGLAQPAVLRVATADGARRVR